MHSWATDASSGMRIGALAQAAGVTRETIHFYLREGLLPPPEKINARVSYFDASHLVRLRLIRAFQEAHVPLARIRQQLEGMEKLTGPTSPAATERAIAVVTEFLDVEGEEPPIDRTEVAERSGLTLEELTRLEELGVLQPQSAGGGSLYTKAEAEAAEAARTIMDQGVPLESLRFVRRYTELTEEEMAFLLHHMIRPAVAAGRRGEVSATLAFRGLRILEAYLRRQYRRRSLLYPPEIPDLPDPLATP